MPKIVPEHVTRIQDLPPVLQLVAYELAMGRTCKEVAEHRMVSVKTIDSQRNTILRKLRLRSNVDLARQAIADGVVPAPEPAWVVRGTDGLLAKEAAP